MWRRADIDDRIKGFIETITEKKENVDENTMRA